ncbi:Hsp20/alpha crystallin family protein [Nitrospina gracilis]|uniref:Hsp20/alpha crystallin family protein n=1 Tax=Nitrospina gracilis TaxID=35801 RepID=UPI001F3EF603|nr:Hsp20/alpha crystallin family protein [Nitrospina gracilis]MCF8719967.1 HSP20 family protein [Nitrospina gracilis Nb-211]
MTKIVSYKPKTYMDKFFEDADWFGQMNPWAPLWEPVSKAQESLRCNIEEKEDRYILTAAVPGWKQEEIDVGIHDGYLTIKGNHQSESKTEDEKYHLREFSHTRFERSFTLGDGIDPEKVEAKLEHGVLTVMLPKKEDMKPRSVKVQVNNA